MEFEDDDLNREVQNIMRGRTGMVSIGPNGGEEISRVQLFIKNMAATDSPESAADIAGIPYEDIEHYLSDPNIHMHIATQRQRTEIYQKLLSINGISSVIGEVIQTAMAVTPDPGLAMAFDPQEMPASAFVYNPGMALKAIEVMVKIKELERRGVTFEDAESGATHKAQQELARAIHDAE